MQYNKDYSNKEKNDKKVVVFFIFILFFRGLFFSVITLLVYPVSQYAVWPPPGAVWKVFIYLWHETKIGT